MSTTTVATNLDPRVTAEITEQIEASRAEIDKLVEQIGKARVDRLDTLTQELQRELAYRDQLGYIRNVLPDVSASENPQVALLAQLRWLGNEARLVAANGRNESRGVVESKGLAVRAVSDAVYYALYDDLRAGK